MATLQIKNKTLYDIPELTKKLGVGKYTIRRYIKLGTLKAVKVGRAYWVDEEELDKLFATGTEKD